MSAAPRTISTAPDLRQLALALGAVLVAVAIVAVVALARPASIKAPSAPAAPVSQFDHGTSSATSGSKSLTVSGTKAAGTHYSTFPYQAIQPSLTVTGTKGGGIQYTGIPYPAPDSAPSHGGRSLRLAQ